MSLEKRISVAPMMDWTDRHCRFFHRLLSPSAWLYTEMVTAGAVIHGDCERLLGFDKAEQPVALQLGGSDPRELAEAAKIGAEYGYDEINLNCGCPSDRVQRGKFGACLMAEPDLVAECVAAMREVVSVPVTVKCRIGIDDSEDYEFLEAFIQKQVAAGCNTFFIHARKAWLKGLSPKENREIPPLRYDVAERLKKEYPHLQIHLNGGVRTAAHVSALFDIFDGVMIGREFYENPYLLAEIEKVQTGAELPARHDVITSMADYIDSQQITAHAATRHMLGLFKGLKGARRWRQFLSQSPLRLETNGNILRKTLESLHGLA
ncbi:MAG: tRNA dihydrouridine(20/20a) synthase DusA [Alphaproteobacteria bacterium]|nr:tRNA dihydrouridine(20/20a) synthase DusA [Alphaproteobacteria bacterium]